MTGRICRDAVLICLAMSGAAWWLWPDHGERAGGVLAGGLLMGYSGWAIAGVVDGLMVAPARARPARVLVKLFTRHAILAAAAYSMMARLHLDPVGMLAGVAALTLAAGVEALRRIQRVS